MRAALYLRVSTLNGHATENQRLEIEAIADPGRDDWDVIESTRTRGAKGGKSRPAFDRMLRAAVRREFDVIMAGSVDRLGRSLKKLVAFVSDMRAKSVELYLYEQGISGSTRRTSIWTGPRSEARSNT